MSDLIERLEERKQNLGGSEAIRIGVPLDLSDLDAILSALKTVRGIEGLANPFSLNIRMFSEGVVFVTTNKGTFQAETLPLAVEAAVEAAGKKQ